MNIIQVFASPFWGGGEQYIYDLSKELIHEGNNVTFISRKSSVIRGKVSKLNKLHIELPFKSLIDFYSVYRLAQYLKNNEIDVIHVHNFKSLFPIAAAKNISKSNAKIVITRHLIKKGKCTHAYRWVYSYIDKLIFVSNLCYNAFFETAPSELKEKSEVVYNAIPKVEHPIVEEDRLRQKYGLASDVPLIVFAGRVAQEKGVETLINALSIIKQLTFHCFIIGTGKDEYVNQLKKEVNDNGLNSKVTFVGFSSNIRNVIKDADLGVAPSICKESFGLTVAEFMQAGKCVVTTNNGAQIEYITHKENGYLISPDDATDLADALGQLLVDNALREKIGKNAVLYFNNHFAYEMFVRNMNNIYDSVINQVCHTEKEPIATT